MLQRVRKLAWLTVALAPIAIYASNSSAAAATLYVSPTGGGGVCSATAPCAAFDTAYDRARPGDTVLVAGGTFGDTQRLSGDKGSKMPVVVRTAPGANVIIEGRLDVRADYVKVIGPLRATQGVDVDDPDKSNPIIGARVTGVSAPSSYIENARDLLISNSRFGGVPGRQMIVIGAWPTSYRISFDNVAFYGNPPTESSQHLECIFATGVRGLAVRNSRFWDCGYFSILIGMCCGAERQPATLVLERNRFGASRCFAGSGGCGSDGRAPFSLMLGTRIDGASRIVRNHFETPPAVNSTFASLTAAANTGQAPKAWKRRLPK